MPCTYATETYNEVLRWLDNTPIEYRANPKLKGSKSFDRYAKYSKAKTVGEALRKGSYYLDLLFDHEHGHLRATGGPKRKELVCPDKSQWDKTWTATDKILSKMHAKWITWTNTFAVADRLGVDRRNLTSNKMGGISVEMHAMRMEAQAMAQLILDEADKRSMPVTDQDMTHVLKLWAWKQNSSRQNVMPDGVEWVKSDTLGLLSSYDGTVLVNSATKYYPAVPKLMCRWLQDTLPPHLRKGGFGFTSINVNRGYAAKLHRDSNNEGPSLIAAFGDFTGGKLRYWGEDDKTLGTPEKMCQPEDATCTDIKEKLLLFDGNRGHAVDDFEGDRFTLVFFSIGRSWKASPGDQQKLRDVGFPFPDAKALERNQSLLTKPLGYGKHAAKAEKGQQRHTSRAWPRASRRSPVVDVLTPEQVRDAKEAAKFVEPPEEDEDVPLDTVWVGHQKDRRTTEEGLKLLRVFLRGESGRLVLAVEGLEQKTGTARYDYRKAESFPQGPELVSNQLGDVIQWINGMVTQKEKKQRKPRADAGEAQTPPKKRKAAPAAAAPAGDSEPADGAKRRKLWAGAAKAMAPKGQPGAAKAVASKVAQSPPAKTPQKGKAQVSPASAAKSPVGKPAKPAKKALSPKDAPKGKQLGKKDALEQLARCKEDTVVEYVPGAKTAESHAASHERYGAYSKASTIVEALERGSKPQDLVYDLQKGFLKLVKGLRSKPLDGSKEGPSRVDKQALRWREEAQRL